MLNTKKGIKLFKNTGENIYLELFINVLQLILYQFVYLPKTFSYFFLNYNFDKIITLNKMCCF